jgi:hypothetical protein
MNLRTALRTLTVSLPLSFASCFEIEAHYVIKPNGSGTLNNHLAMSQETYQRMQAMAKMAQAMGNEEDAGSDPTEIFDEAKMRAKAKAEGITLSSYKTWEKEDKKHVEMQAVFQTIKELKESKLGGGDADMFFLEGDKKGTVRLLFYPQGKLAYEKAQEEIAKLAAAGEEAMAMQEAMFNMMKAQMAGLKMVIKFSVPGKILSVGKGLVVDQDGVTASFTMTDADIKSSADAQRVQSTMFELVFDGSEVAFPLDAAPAAKVGAEGGGDGSDKGSDKGSDTGGESRGAATGKYPGSGKK